MLVLLIILIFVYHAGAAIYMRKVWSRYRRLVFSGPLSN